MSNQALIMIQFPMGLSKSSYNGTIIKRRMTEKKTTINIIEQQIYPK